MVICLERGAVAHSPTDATATHRFFASVKSRLVLPLWYRLTRVVPDKGPLNGCVLALEMASPGNQHCANCIGTLSFPIRRHPQRSGTRIVIRDTIKGGVRNVTRSHAHRLAWMLRDKRPTSCARSAPAVDWGIPACTRLRRNFPGRLRLSLSGSEGGPTSRPPSIAAFIRDSERRPCQPRIPSRSASNILMACAAYSAHLSKIDRIVHKVGSGKSIP